MGMENGNGREGGGGEKAGKLRHARFCAIQAAVPNPFNYNPTTIPILAA
jgi:hypothetical protein